MMTCGKFVSAPSVWVLFLSTFLVSNASGSIQFDLDFSDGKLPSQAGQGLSFAGSSGVTEANVFSVSNGILRVDTTGAASGVSAGYQINPNGFDSAIDVSLEFRARTLKTTGSFGMFFGFRDASAYGAIQVTETGWSLVDNGFSGTFSDTSAFHDFRLTKAGGSNAFQLAIDGQLVASGTLKPGSGSYVYFGDGTPSGGNIQGEIDYIRYSNAPFTNTAVPEPSGLVVFSACFACLAGWGLKRRKGLIPHAAG